MSILDTVKKNKKKMNRIRWIFNYITLPLCLLIFLFLIIIYLILVIKYDVNKILFGVIYLLSIISLILYLFLVNKKIVKIELLQELGKHNFNYVNLDKKKYYQLNLVDVNGTQEYITFMENKLHMFGQTFNYEDLWFYFVSNNKYKTVNLDIKIYFSDPKDVNSSYMLLVLDNLMLMILKQFDIKIENQKELDYLVENKEAAFKQILRYSKIKYIEGRNK